MDLLLEPQDPFKGHQIIQSRPPVVVAVKAAQLCTVVQNCDSGQGSVSGDCSLLCNVSKYWLEISCRGVNGQKKKPSNTSVYKTLLPVPSAALGLLLPPVVLCPQLACSRFHAVRLSCPHLCALNAVIAKVMAGDVLSSLRITCDAS